MTLSSKPNIIFPMAKELTARELQSRGGKARARNLSKERLREIAAMGGRAIAGRSRHRRTKAEIEEEKRKQARKRKKEPRNDGHY